MRGTASATLALRTETVGCALAVAATGIAEAAVEAGAADAAADAAGGAIAGAMLGDGFGGGALGAAAGGGGAISARPFKPRSGSVSRPRRPNMSGAPLEPAGQAGEQLVRALLRRLDAANLLGQGRELARRLAVAQCGRQCRAHRRGRQRGLTLEGDGAVEAQPHHALEFGAADLAAMRRTDLIADHHVLGGRREDLVELDQTQGVAGCGER